MATRAVDATATHCAASGTSCIDHGYKYGRIFITDAKRVDPPAAPLAPADPEVFAREKDSHQGTDLSPSMGMSRAVHSSLVLRILLKTLTDLVIPISSDLEFPAITSCTSTGDRILFCRRQRGKA
jgi:hypothetical protein